MVLSLTLSSLSLSLHIHAHISIYMCGLSECLIQLRSLGILFFVSLLTSNLLYYTMHCTCVRSSLYIFCAVCIYQSSKSSHCNYLWTCLTTVDWLNFGNSFFEIMLARCVSGNLNLQFVTPLHYSQLWWNLLLKTGMYCNPMWTAFNIQ